MNQTNQVCYCGSDLTSKTWIGCIQSSFTVCALQRNEICDTTTKSRKPFQWQSSASAVLLLLADTFPHHSAHMHCWKHFHLFLMCVSYKSTGSMRGVCGWLWRKPSAHLCRALLDAERRFKCCISDKTPLYVAVLLVQYIYIHITHMILLSLGCVKGRVSIVISGVLSL